MPYILQKVQGDETIAGGFTRTSMVQFVEGEELLIGRGARADLRFDDPAVALEHAVIRPREGGFEIADLGSLTGTYVNGKRVERAPVEDKVWIDIGRHRLTLAISGPGMPVVVSVQELEERQVPVAAVAEGERLQAPEVDYLAAFGLRRRLFNKAALSWMFVGGALAALVAVLWAGRTEAFRPGPVSDAHAPIASDCRACHGAWQGPNDELCAECHAGPEHQPRQVAAPGCSTCHVEHRFTPELARIGDGKCVDCHADLEVEDGGPLIFARRVTRFAADHPEFALSVPGPQGRPRRLRLGEPGSRQADAAVIALNHALHLRPDLKSPEGPVQLDCFSCHTPARERGEILPLNYERHCQSCHRLSFDPRFPDAPHETPEKVHAFLLRTYAEDQEKVRPLRQQRRLLPRRGGREPAPKVLELDERVLRQVVEAEYNLYRSACSKCHEVDLSGVLPAVVEPAVPERWFDYATFTHHAHRMVECSVCHAGATASRRTEDVLLPGIEICRDCHAPSALGGKAATTRCVSCHYYHDKSRTGEWGRAGQRGTWEAESGLADLRGR